MNEWLRDVIQNPQSAPGSGPVVYVNSSDSRLTNARTPVAHSHAPEDVIGTAVVTNDSRLSDSRTPLFPIGYIYISAVSTNPATALGYGTWAAFGAGRVLVGLDSGDTDFDTAEETGGSKTVASSAQAFAGNALATHQHAAVSAGTPSGTNAGEAAHTHGVTSNVAIAAEAAHTHAAGAISWPAGVPTTANHTSVATKQGTAAGNVITVGTHSISWPAGVPTSAATAAGSSHTHTVTNNAVTSAAGSSHTHAFTGDALTTHQHAAISAGTPSGSNSPGAATSVVQPYIVVYMFKRTA